MINSATSSLVLSCGTVFLGADLYSAGSQIVWGKSSSIVEQTKTSPIAALVSKILNYYASF